jgi:tetrahydromethanopterin S-methyltransferase subunit F
MILEVIYQPALSTGTIAGCSIGLAIALVMAILLSLFIKEHKIKSGFIGLFVCIILALIIVPILILTGVLK